MPAAASAPALVVITYNRREGLLANLERLTALVEAGDASEVVVVDNASTDGTSEAVRARFPAVRLVTLTENLGAPGRTVGVEATDAELIAFADDDSWWAPGALPRATAAFAAHPRLGLVHAHVVVEPHGEVDPICDQLARGPRLDDLPGPEILGHLACAVVVRRQAYLEAGGYSPLLGFGGEERLLALDLAARGWRQCYLEDVVAHHEPSPARADWPKRWARYRRNDVLTSVLRFPLGVAARDTAELLREGLGNDALRRELGPFLRRLGGAVRERRQVPEPVWRHYLETTAQA
jgi:glycosyltransferase involved in cell wall biosynthesis